MTSRADDAALPLDALLVEGALGPRERLLPVGPAVRWGLSALRSPLTAVGRAAGLAAELGRIALGVRPAAHTDDPRHADIAWTDAPVPARLLQSHRATRDAALGLVDDLADGDGIDSRDADRLRFAVSRMADLLAPGTLPRKGLRALVEDLARPPRIPEGRVRPLPGTDTATAPGAVVRRTEVAELLHYLPATEQVDEVPVLIVPGVANSLALADLAPHRSLVRRLVGDGRQVLALSWNPAAAADLGLDAYVATVVEAADAAMRICRTDRIALLGWSTGGLLAMLAAARQAGVVGLVLGGTAVERDRTPVLPVEDADVRAAVAAATRRGRVRGSDLVTLHALLCPDELLWPAWERRYVTGSAPDPLRAWNLDARDVPAALFRDLVGGAAEIGDVAADAYLVAGMADRVGSWQGVYRTSQSLAGKTRFVLVPGSTAAAVAGDVGMFRAADAAVSAGNPADPERWRAASHPVRGSWWDDLSDWLGERCGVPVDAPPELGGRGLHPIHPAPGTYLQCRAPEGTTGRR